MLGSKIAATVWIREAMEVVANPYGNWEFENNAITYRAVETEIADLAEARPGVAQIALVLARVLDNPRAV